MVKVVWTRQALGDLEGIRDYLLEVASDRVMAEVCGGIVAAVESLAAHPRSGWREPDIEQREIRNRLYGRYRIMYEIREDGSLLVATIRHTSRDDADLVL